MNGERFLPFGSNAGYLAELYQLYLSDPSVVSPEWVEFFKSVDQSAVPGLKNGHANGYTNGHVSTAEVRSSSNAIGDKLVEAYRIYGHAAARLSPLVAGGLKASAPVELSLAYQGEEREPSKVALASYSHAGVAYSSCEQLIQSLREAYCGTIGFEYMHLTRAEERVWLQARIESRPRSELSVEERRSILRDLVHADLFESELHRKYVGTKRFSLEGNDTLIPLVSALVKSAAARGVKGIVCGMAHRGRLNVLVNSLGKSLGEMFAEFEDRTVATIAGAGDVKYHHGYQTHQAANGVEIDMQLLPNPSHLEFVNPVVEGVVRALQDRADRNDRKTYLPLAMHGDAAVAGQGIVFETLNYSGLVGYSTGGTFHIVINNQIGFTTTPDESRSTRYCTDLVKGLDCPVFHVNAEDPEAACWITQLALEYRMVFGKDVFVDLIGHRKHGHNEGDDPSFTQPSTYVEVREKKPIWRQYGEGLIAAGVLTQSDVDAEVEQYKKHFAEAHSDVGSNIGSEATPIHGKLHVSPPDTGVSADVLTRIAHALVEFPDTFKPHPKLAKIIEKRVDTVVNGQGIEWGVAEALAFGSLLLEGKTVRLSGQDCGRGTFSHRHLLLDDYEGGMPWSPLMSMAEREASGGYLEIVNSSLSEAAVLGFEFGYSATNQDALTMWEAQFGDFSNGAQVIIDQFITSSESKWAQRSGVVMMLPHGYEGQGPEHSSARLERYLQMCAEGNMRVCYPSTAAQYFHLMRRQGITAIKRPLIIMTPKSLLRLPAAMSALSEMTSGSFNPVLSTDLAGKVKCDNLVFCSGKVFHDLYTAFHGLNGLSARIIRVEELYPFPQAEIVQILKETGASKALWVQEEPQNMGAWSFVAPHLREVLSFEPAYVGRAASAATATGSGKHHALEQKGILARVLEHLSAR